MLDQDGEVAKVVPCAMQAKATRDQSQELPLPSLELWFVSILAPVPVDGIFRKLMMSRALSLRELIYRKCRSLERPLGRLGSLSPPEDTITSRGGYLALNVLRVLVPPSPVPLQPVPGAQVTPKMLQVVLTLYQHRAGNPFALGLAEDLQTMMLPAL